MRERNTITDCIDMILFDTIRREREETQRSPTQKKMCELVEDSCRFIESDPDVRISKTTLGYRLTRLMLSGLLEVNNPKKIGDYVPTAEHLEIYKKIRRELYNEE